MLKVHEVYELEFVAFIDNLIVVQIDPAPLQAIDIVGTGIGFVYVDHLQLSSSSSACRSH